MMIQITAQRRDTQTLLRQNYTEICRGDSEHLISSPNLRSQLFLSSVCCLNVKVPFWINETVRVPQVPCTKLTISC